MLLSLDDLCQALHEQAFWTNRMIHSGYSSRLGILEETITDVNLLEIASRFSTYMLTRKYTRREEGSTSGADWLWCIGEPGSWISLLVQAKIIHPSTKKCHHLNYTTKHGSQCTVLTNYARTHKLLPMYCIYSYIDSSLHPYSKAFPALESYSSQDWACSFITPKYVKRLIKEKRIRQNDILQYAIPWLYPFCNSANDRLAYSFANALTDIRSAFISNEKGAESITIEDITLKKGRNKQNIGIQWDDPDPSRLVTQSLPSIAVKLLNNKVFSTQSPIGGVTIISSVPISRLNKEIKTLPSDLNKTFVSIPSIRNKDNAQELPNNLD
jgi:hypothetical protein